MEPTGSEEVKIPELAPNGQNWKIYRAKIIEAAATDITDPLGVLAGWQPDNGSYDWECLDAILKWTFYTTVPISILCPIWKLDTVHEIFKYLAKRFRNNEPIPRANEFQCAGTAAVAETSEKSPTSTNTATERHANAKLDEEDLSTTKALTRGTEDVDNGNVGRTEDPRTSYEALAKGISAECAEMTSVILESAPHEMQTEPHSSLLLTPRPPIEGEPRRCKQEVAESVVTATHTNGMVRLAKPTEITDIDRTTLLGGELAERVCGVNEGDGMERESKLRLQQMKLHCKEADQHNGNTMEDVPIANGLPLEGEWTAYPSSETTNLKGVELEGRESSTDERASNEPTELLTTTVEPYVDDGDTSPLVRIGGTNWCAGSAKGPGCQTDGSDCQTGMSSSQADAPRAQMDAPSTLNKAETDVMDHGDGVGTYLSIGDSKHDVREMDGVGSHADMLTGQTDTPHVETDANLAANVKENVRLPRKKDKPPNLPVEASRGHPDEPDGCGNHADASSARTDSHCIGNEMEMAANRTGNVRTRRTEEKTRNSPTTPENATPKPADRWRKVSAEEIDVEGGDKAIAPSVEGERACDGDGDRNSDDGDDGEMATKVAQRAAAALTQCESMQRC
ncbi:hypothetical protein SCLCIDRAFT_32076 [Scleroderma citrinum Foug A]|uniref:Uncharacterized protein n=1 Tax=Scleroderma citrinum Foug A TaxID=1036808 RepID=A0A0C3DAU5_9AGAM|nr:hypothetical protein SCLCIDRAFT_32076 [Scleroderma citrinum Foug A]